MKYKIVKLNNLIVETLKRTDNTLSVISDTLSDNDYDIELNPHYCDLERTGLNIFYNGRNNNASILLISKTGNSIVSDMVIDLLRMSPVQTSIDDNLFFYISPNLPRLNKYTFYEKYTKATVLESDAQEFYDTIQNESNKKLIDTFNIYHNVLNEYCIFIYDTNHIDILIELFEQCMENICQTPN